MFDISRKYRTIHSISDTDVEKIIMMIEKIKKENNNTIKNILDYGCHLGHLSIELAIRYDSNIYSVDNFVGTTGDNLMSETISKITNNGNDFYNIFIENLCEAEKTCCGFVGKIIPMKNINFLNSAIELDFAFIDSSHKVEDSWEFKKISDMVKIGGILGGHDNYTGGGEGVIEGISKIENDYEWIENGTTFFMKKIK